MSKRNSNRVKDTSFYAELDENTGMWCVFGEESGKAYSSWMDKNEAKEDAKQRNNCH